MKKIVSFLAVIIVIILGAWLWADHEAEDGMIVINYPRTGDEISSPLVVKGKARGNWYFEADFPVIITDWDGVIIGQGYATAKSDWMTEEFVEFEGTIEFMRNERSMQKNNGSVIFQKDNPSGLPEHDDAREIPVYFK